MSLFKWSTPERRCVDRILPIIPNEIYLDIFEHIAPSTGNLTPEQLQIFSNLSCICRFFANCCLPRVFECVDFSGSVFRDDTNYKTSRESTLCAQIAAKQPLALSLAQRVKVCRFINWKRSGSGAWAVRSFVRKYLAGMAHMKNISQLTFSDSFVDKFHWDAIAALPSLQELSFDKCSFLRGPADVETEKGIMIKVSRLQVTRCFGHHYLLSAVDPQSLRTLVADYWVAVGNSDWPSLSAVTELRICPPFLANGSHQWQVLYAVVQAPPSVETLSLSLDASAGSTGVDVLDDLSLLLDAIYRLQNLQSFTLKGNQADSQISLEEVRGMLDDKVGSASSLRYVDIDGMVLRFVDGEWSEVTCSAA